MNRWPFYLAGAGSGALTAILDFIKDWNNGTVARVASGLGQHLFAGTNLYLSPAFWAIVMIIIVSLFVCWVFEVTSRLDGFLRGCTVMAAFSIGAPNALIDQQANPIRNPNIALSINAARLAGFSTIISPAIAQSSSLRGAAVGEAYVRLAHLQKIVPVPESTVTVRDDASRIISLFKITDDTIKIVQPYGNYLVEVQTPGFADIDFELKIDEPVSGNKVNARRSSLPLVIQKLVSATKVDLTADDAEKYKQLGRQQRFAGNWDAAIANYRKSLDLDPNDVLTHDYLGYALFRAGKYQEATKEFNLVIERKPDYEWSHVNLIKVDCAQQKYEEARQKLDTLRAKTDNWKSDAELSRICLPIMN
jgi:hypothetical protein